MDAETAARVLCAYLKRAYEAGGMRWNHINQSEVMQAFLTLANPPEPEITKPDPATLAEFKQIRVQSVTEDR